MYSLHHVAISVADLERSKSFYHALGFETAADWAAPDGNLRIVHLKGEGMMLELFAFADGPPPPDSSGRLETDLPRRGIKHFGLAVEDIRAAREKIVGLGLHDGPEIVEGRTGVLYFFINDPDGTWVEFVQDDRGIQ